MPRVLHRHILYKQWCMHVNLAALVLPTAVLLTLDVGCTLMELLGDQQSTVVSCTCNAITSLGVLALACAEAAWPCMATS